MQTLIKIIEKLAEIPSVSGKESGKRLMLSFPSLSKASVDECGNVILRKEGYGKKKQTILFEAHMDTIGLCVEEILENGFLSVLPCGGIDHSILPGTEMTIWGKIPCKAVAVSIPPHLKAVSTASNEKRFCLVDTGLKSKSKALKWISAGDVGSFCRPIRYLANSRISASYWDNRCSVATLLLAIERFESVYHDVIFLFSVGEETTSRGVRVFCQKHSPDCAVILDAGFGTKPGENLSKCIVMGAGPSVSFTDTLSFSMTKWIQNVAKTNRQPLQTVAEPGGTGTSATALQTENGGIPSAVISIPIMNMHTPAEICDLRDIESTARLVSLLADSEIIPRKEQIILE